MDTKYLVIGAIVGLVIGSGGVYILQNGQTQGYLDDIAFLEGENAKLQSQLESERDTVEGLTEYTETVLAEMNSLESQIDDLNGEIQTLENQIVELNSQLSELDELREINASYIALLETLDGQVMNNLTRVYHYNLSAGERQTYTFIIDHGILWDVTIDYSGSYVSISISWRKGELQGFVGSSGRAVSEGYPYLYGPITVTIYNDKPNQLTVSSNIQTNYSYVGRGGSATFDISQ